MKNAKVENDINEVVYDDDLHLDVVTRRQINKSHNTMLRGYEWFIYGWYQFKNSPALFVIGAVIWISVEIGFALIPFIGEIIDGLLIPFLYAGFLHIADDLEEKGKVSFMAFFKGFSGFSKILKLFIMGIPMVMFEVIEFLVFIMLGPLFALLMAAPLLVIVLCGLIYAVPLVIFKNYSALEAIKSSYRICGNNILPLITIFLMMLIFFIVGIMSFGLAFVVFVPVTFCALYESQKCFV